MNEENKTTEEKKQGGEFIESLNSLTGDDIAPPKPEEKKDTKKTVFKWVERGITFALVIVFIASISVVIGHFSDYGEAEQKIDSVNDYIFGKETEVFSALGKNTELGVIYDFKTLNSEHQIDFQLDEDYQSGDIDMFYERIKTAIRNNAAKNPDTYGYIYVPDSNIKVILVQGKDNYYYLFHDYEGGDTVVGSAYVDCENDRDPEENLNTVIYGHNMANGTIFNNVQKFAEEEFFTDHNIYIYTLDGIYTYEPFSIYETKSDYAYAEIEFGTTEDYLDFCNRMQDNSFFNRNVEFTEEDRILTLSTCLSGVENGRYALHARLVDVRKPNQ